MASRIEYATSPQMSFQEMCSLDTTMRRARLGSLDDMQHLAYELEFEDVPQFLLDNAFDVACGHIENNNPPEIVHSKPAVYLGKIIACSFAIIIKHRDLCSMAASFPFIPRLLQMWPRAFEWAQHLRASLDFFNVHDMGNEEKSLCVKLAGGINHFFDIISSYDNVEERLREENVLNLMAEYWATSSNVPEIANLAGSTLNSYASSIYSDRELDGLLDILQNKLGSAQEVALHALSNARMSASSGVTKEDDDHYDILFMLFVQRPAHATSRAVLEAGVVPFLMDTLSDIASSTNDDPTKALPGQRTLFAFCTRMLAVAYGRPTDGRTWIRKGLKCGQLEIFFKAGRFFENLDQVDQEFITRMFSGSILPFMHLTAIFNRARRAMTSLSKSLNNSPFAFEGVPGSFRGIWTEFETCLLEHAILRRLRTLGDQDKRVYCGNIACQTKKPQHEFLRCAGCRLAIYCSHLCQRNSWPLGHRGECGEMMHSIPEENNRYILYWVLSQITPLIPDLRQLALLQFPAVPFEEIGFYADLTRWPMQVLLHPLQISSHALEKPEVGTTHAMHFRNLAMKRVNQGDVNATMLTIHFNKMRGKGLQYAVVDLDKNPPERPERSEASTRKCVVDLNQNPINATQDTLDVIMGDLKTAAELDGKNIWSPGFLQTHIQAA